MKQILKCMITVGTIGTLTANIEASVVATSSGVEFQCPRAEVLMLDPLIEPNYSFEQLTNHAAARNFAATRNIYVVPNLDMSSTAPLRISYIAITDPSSPGIHSYAEALKWLETQPLNRGNLTAIIEFPMGRGIDQMQLARAIADIGVTTTSRLGQLDLLLPKEIHNLTSYGNIAESQFSRSIHEGFRFFRDLNGLSIESGSSLAETRWPATVEGQFMERFPNWRERFGGGPVEARLPSTMATNLSLPLGDISYGPASHDWLNPRIDFPSGTPLGARDIKIATSDYVRTLDSNPTAIETLRASLNGESAMGGLLRGYIRSIAKVCRFIR